MYRHTAKHNGKEYKVGKYYSETGEIASLKKDAKDC
jgi:hypothetical protein